MTLPVKPQTSIQLSAYIVKAFVSPTRLEDLGDGQIIKGSTDRPTKERPSPHTRCKGGQGTQDIIDDYFVHYIKPCISQLGR